MEQKSCSVFLFFFLFCMLLLCFSGAEAYKNYTVGDSLGWFDNLQKPKVNYQKWVVGKNFSLGDFLIFNTDTNHTVIQTYNLTTYKRCDYDNAETDDTVEWSAGEPTTDAQPVTVPVPLTKEGMQYFFSGNYDGEQCKHGQHFKVNVTHGQGLPASLKDQPEDSPAPNSPDDDSTPDTVIPSNFNNPVEGGDDVKGTSGAISSVRFVRIQGWKLNGVMVVLVFLWVFG